jgi:uncharacterized peroxidase-related enzyme
MDDAWVDQVRDDWRQADLSPRHAALCAYADKLTRTPGAMTADDLAPLRALGLKDRDLLDLVQVVGYFNYINRVADGLGVRDEEEWSAPRHDA